MLCRLVLTLCAATPMGVAAQPLPALDVNAYMGLWHQQAHYPNRFQAHCVAATTAHYALRDDGRIQVRNRCRDQAGAWDEVHGMAEPRGAARIDQGQLAPASLRVSFLPGWLRWLPVGWGDYDVVRLLDEGRVAIVSEPSRAYLWVLSRERHIDEACWARVRDALAADGYDLTRLQRTPD